MNRRSFLKWLGGTAAGVAAAHTLDLDKLLWVPGEKTIFIPPPPVGETWLSTALHLQKGDLFTIEGIYALNPLTYQDSGVLQQFVITDDVGPGGITANVMWPPIIEEGPYSTVRDRLRRAARRAERRVRPLWVGQTVPVTLT